MVMRAIVRLHPLPRLGLPSCAVTRTTSTLTTARAFSGIKHVKAAYARPPPRSIRSEPAERAWVLSTTRGWRDTRSVLSRLKGWINYICKREYSFAAKFSVDAEASIMEKAVKEFKKDQEKRLKHFSIVQRGAEVRFVKQHRAESILVMFNVNHASEESDGEDMFRRIPITIEITKGDERLCFYIVIVEDVIRERHDFYVEELYIAPAVKAGIEEVPPAWTYETSRKRRCMPSGKSLYIKYLAERGLDSKFFGLVKLHFDEYDLYLRLVNLNRAKAFKAKGNI